MQSQVITTFMLHLQLSSREKNDNRAESIYPGSEGKTEVEGPRGLALPLQLPRKGSWPWLHEQMGVPKPHPS